MDRQYHWLLFSLLIFFIAGCDIDGGAGTDNFTAQELTEQGWTLFISKNYKSAANKFVEAFGKDPGYTEAYTGAGWAYARSLNLDKAVDSFSAGIALNTNLADAHAGLAFVYNAQKSYQNSIQSAQQALTINANWNFAHDQTLDYQDLHLLMAESYFALLDFNNSLAQVKLLNPAFDVDVTTYEGRSALAAEIERLRGIV
ncbi:MAG TPA: hypothetical protein ENN22_13645 [bacterium]|nr:hypothetical protein [bacterium]